MNILFLASAVGIHDHKWMMYFSQDIRNNVYLVCEVGSLAKADEKTLCFLKENRIHVCEPIREFSFRNINQKRKSIKKLRKICDEHDIDIVHALFAVPNAMWAYFTKKKFVITTRGSDMMKVMPELRRPGLRKFYMRYLFLIYKKAFLTACYITSTSGRQKSKIEEIFGRHDVELVRTGVEVESISNINTEEYIPEALKGKKMVLSPRMIHPLYNTEVQAKAIAKLEKRYLDEYTFVFFKNHNTSPDYLEQVLHILDANNDIDYHVFDLIPQTNMLACVRVAALCIMIPERDGTPNSALEAMAARCPLIVGNFDYDDDLFTNTCMRLNSNTVEDLLAAMRQALDHYPDGMLDHAFSIVSKFGNRPVEMEKIQRIYSELTANDRTT